MIVTNKIGEKTYCRLIEYASKKCDAVMFVFRRDGFNQQEILQLENSLKQLKKILSGSLLKNRNGGHWVFTRVGYTLCKVDGFCDPPGFDKIFDILFFKLTEDVEKYLLSNTQIYSWLNPDYPENVSFFKDGYCWLRTVTHEKICDIFCEDEEEYDYLKSIGLQFRESKFTPTTIDELYYEDYGLDKIKETSRKDNN